MERTFGPATENLWRDVNDDSGELEKALWHFLNYVYEDAPPNPDLKRTLAAVEDQLSRLATGESENG